MTATSGPIREAPFNLKTTLPDPTRPSVTEPVLALNNIQGNIIGGFNKDQQIMLFLQIDDVERFRHWLKAFIPFVATSAEVLRFNNLFKEIRRRRGAETATVQATWTNIALSFKALRALARDENQLKANAKNIANLESEIGGSANWMPDAFKDEAFKGGMASRAVAQLSDPADPAAEGNPSNWLFGGPGEEPDAVIIVGSDTAADLADEVARIEDTLYSMRLDDGQVSRSGATIVFKQQGATLPPPLTGHEHFGFLDGVSQPGIRGRLSDDPTDVLTPRQNPDNPDQGKPGQDLLWPGEFVFGYPGQNATAKPVGKENQEEAEDRAVKEPGPDSLTGKDAGGHNVNGPAGPVWAKDGSFLVIRRLRQDVDGFHKFLKKAAADLQIPGNAPDELLGAKLVGRWKSGAPIIRSDPDNPADNPVLADNDCANNHFEFQKESRPIEERPNPFGSKCPIANPWCSDDRTPQSPGDPEGRLIPDAAHIRKTYPRDDTGSLATQIGELTTQTHRLLRRGIPFGPPFYPAKDPAKSKDTGNRGLVFAAYQTSITRQFEFVQGSWANNAEFKDSEKAPVSPKTPNSGHDLIIGQHNGENGSRERKCPITFRAADHSEKTAELVAPRDWVIPTGGGYFFAPSIDALCLLTGTARR
jgi:Dyp-type peroxidase family